MLCLSRRISETVTVEHGGERLEIMLTETDGGRARLGFTGPLSFRVLRSELVRETAQTVYTPDPVPIGGP